MDLIIQYLLLIWWSTHHDYLGRHNDHTVYMHGIYVQYYHCMIIYDCIGVYYCIIIATDKVSLLKMKVQFSMNSIIIILFFLTLLARGLSQDQLVERDFHQECLKLIHCYHHLDMTPTYWALQYSEFYLRMHKCF